MDLVRRPRRLRVSKAVRDLVHETDIRADDLIYPIFVVEGEQIKTEIASMPGIYHYSLDMLEAHLREVAESGVNAVIFFGVPEHKDEMGSGAYDDNGIVQRALRLTKKLYPDRWYVLPIYVCANIQVTDIAAL